MHLFFLLFPIFFLGKEDIIKINLYICLLFDNNWKLLFIIMEKIDNLDRQILEIISQNARIPFKDVAAECGVSRAAIHQRVQRLIDLGVIVGSGYHVNPKSLGYRTCTYVGIKLETVLFQLRHVPVGLVHHVDDGGLFHGLVRRGGGTVRSRVERSGGIFLRSFGIIQDLIDCFL